MVENIDRVMETVAMEKKKMVWMGASSRRSVEEIYSSLGDVSEEEKLHRCADIYASCATHSSWQHLNEVLYYNNEMKAARKAKAFLQNKDG